MTKGAKQTGVKVYFADPYSPWQRGIHENTNGLLRQFLSKSANLARFTQTELDAIAWKLNTRPRKSLGWKCPAELFMPNSTSENIISTVLYFDLETAQISKFPLFSI